MWRVVPIIFYLVKVWQEKRNLPEHQEESSLEFYMWRVILMIGYIIIIMTAPSLLVIFMVAANYWPNSLAVNWPYLSLFAVGFLFLLVICLCGFLVFFSLQRFETLVLRIELRNYRGTKE